MAIDENGDVYQDDVRCDKCHSWFLECVETDSATLCIKCCHCGFDCWDDYQQRLADNEPYHIDTQNSKELTGLELAGHITVDSGQVIVGDPCYLKVWDGNENDPFSVEGQQGQYSYLGSCEATLSENGFGTLNLGFAVALSAGYGDGDYPVYVKKNNDGKIALAIIDFTGEYLGDDDESV